MLWTESCPHTSTCCTCHLQGTGRGGRKWLRSDGGRESGPFVPGSVALSGKTPEGRRWVRPSGDWSRAAWLRSSGSRRREFRPPVCGVSSAWLRRLLGLLPRDAVTGPSACRVFCVCCPGLPGQGGARALACTPCGRSPGSSSLPDGASSQNRAQAPRTLVVTSPTPPPAPSGAGASQ